MKNLGLEEIEALFQTWPESFLHRFNRKLTKSEILNVIQERSKELQAIELKRTFENYSYQSLMNIKEFLNNTEVEFLDSENNKAHKFNIIDKLSAKKSDT